MNSVDMFSEKKARGGVRIAFSETDNEVIQQAIKRGEAEFSDFEACLAEDLVGACKMVADGMADGMIAGIDYTSREVILACREYIGTREGKTAETTEAGATGVKKSGLGQKKATFSASFVLSKGGECYVIGDAAACKNPTEEQLYDITLQTYETAQAVLETEPKVAILSFSTLGSGGKDESIERARAVVQRIRTARPEILIDGEMQLDAAVNLRVAEKKAFGSGVAGRANVLILPDLNSGNILYKAMEQFGGFTAAGPILQGFRAPCSDLSRGSTVEDALAVIRVVRKQILINKGGGKDF